MLQIENKYETTIESNYYQNNNIYFQNSDNTQNINDYTDQALTGSSITNKKYQNTTNKVQLTKQKNLDNSTSLRKFKKERFSITRPRN